MDFEQWIQTYQPIINRHGFLNGAVFHDFYQFLVFLPWGSDSITVDQCNPANRWILMQQNEEFCITNVEVPSGKLGYLITRQLHNQVPMNIKVTLEPEIQTPNWLELIAATRPPID